MKRLCVISLGCPKNRVDSENIIGMILRDGFALTDDEHDCDVLLINTCGFIESAKKEALSEIALAARKRGKSKRPLIVVAGCLVQRYAQVLEREFPEINAFIGVHDLDRASEVVSRAMEGERPVSVGSLRREAAQIMMPRHLTTPQHMAYLKISEGCDNKCTYCAIPLIRGQMVSRRLENLIEEAQALSDLGVKELVLVAQDPTRYGLDLENRHLLPELVERLGGLGGIRWLRLMYAHPSRMPVLLDALLASAKVCRYADIPVQHASARVLSLMGRRSSGDEILCGLETLRKSIPGISLRSTFMVGFPGETENDFKELLSFIRLARFEHAGVFRFSPEEDTAAFNMPGAVDAQTVDARFAEATRLQQKVSDEEQRCRLGLAAEFIVEKATGGCYLGRTEFQAPEIDGITRLEWKGANLVPGDIVECTLQSVKHHDFLATGRQPK